MINKFKKVLVTVVALAALALGGSALAGAASGGGSEAGDTSQAIAGDAKSSAEQAALAETGGGKVNQSELDNENGATYEVEVARRDGTQVDVRLDDKFNVVTVESDSEDGDGETADGPDKGPDQNPGEPGHQDEKPGA